MKDRVETQTFGGSETKTETKGNDCSEEKQSNSGFAV